MKQTILITGGLGYIGSHIACYFLKKNYRVIILDYAADTIRGKIVTEQLQLINRNVLVINGDYGDRQILDNIFLEHIITAVIHCASLIEVHESVCNPAIYYHNNVAKTITLFDAMRRHNIHNIIFSSSCAVYGIPQWLPLTEDHPCIPISPYGKTKYMIEQILHDYSQAYDIRFVALRYFNAAGALPEYNLGERHEPESHLIPRVIKAALYQEKFTIFGKDLSTPDGTCIRDFIHVYDVAYAHDRALEYLVMQRPSVICNLGTGSGYSVRNIIDVIQNVTGSVIECVYQPARSGDPAVLIAEPQHAQHLLGWSAQISDITSIITSSYEFYKNYFVHEQPPLKKQSYL